MMYKFLLLSTLYCLSWQMARSNCMDDCEAKPSVFLAEKILKSFTTTLKKGMCRLSDSKIWPEDYAEKVLKDGGMREYFDFIIVGAGTAGSVVASRLSENLNQKVLVLEAGGDPPIDSEMFTLSSSLVRTKYTWDDYMEPNPNCCQALKEGRCFMTRGKMIGGGGGSNENVFLQGNKPNFDEWTKAGNKGWTWEDAKFYYKKAATPQGNSSSPMGGLTLNIFEDLPQNEAASKLMFDSFNELGIQRVPGFDDKHTVGITTNIPTTTANGIRMSTGKVYLANMARKRSNLKVIKNAHVTNLLFNDKNRVVGVNFTLPGNRSFSVRSTKEVILSAGALASPHILLLSGIGPRQHLESMGVPVRKDLQVGKNLQDHAMLQLYFKVNGNLTSINDEYQNIMDYFLHSKGYYANGYSLVGFVNTKLNSTSRYPDWQIHSPKIIESGNTNAAEFFNVKPEIWELVNKDAGKKQILAIFGSSMNPNTRGRLELRSNNPFDTAKIFFEYGEHRFDKGAVLNYLTFIGRLVETEAIKKHQISLIHIPLPECKNLPAYSDEYWLCYAKYFLISSFHPVGTCKMGSAQDAEAVVDDRLRVRGVEGLRVVDASIMPTITSGNTNGPAIMIGEKGADMIKEDWKNYRFPFSNL